MRFEFEAVVVNRLPVGLSRIELAPSSTLVLYGVNGAGKSRLLQAVSGVLGGDETRGHVELHLVDGPDSNDVLDIADDLTQRLADTWTLARRLHAEVGHGLAAIDWLQQDADALDELVALHAAGADESVGWWRERGLGWLLGRTYLLEVGMQPLGALSRHADFGGRAAAAIAESLAAEPRLVLSGDRVSAGVRPGDCRADLRLLAAEASADARASRFSILEPPSTPRQAAQRLLPITSTCAKLPELVDLSAALPVLDLRIGGEGLRRSHLDVINLDNKIELTELTHRVITGRSPTALPHTGARFDSLRPVRLLVDAFDRDEFTVPDETSHVIGRLQELANETAQRLCPEIPPLRLDITPPLTWSAQDPLIWSAQLPEGRAVELSQLSTAQRRWAVVAIRLACDAIGPPPRSFEDTRASGPRRVLVVDEPEHALHRGRERRLATELRSLVAEHGWSVVAATHSPDFLSAADRRLHVRVGDSGSRLVHIDRLVDGRMLDELGLNAHDLFSVIGAFVIVEGEHDLTVLDEFIGDDLDRLGVRVLPMRGTDHLHPILDAQVLVGMTDVPLVVVLDGLDGSIVLDAWRQALTESDVRQARKRLDRTEARTVESRDMAAFLREALSHPARERVIPYGFVERDIITYLPVDSFMEGEGDWSELEAAYRQYRTSNRTPLDFKGWLRRFHQAEIHTGTIRKGARRLDSVPAEFVALLDVIATANGVTEPSSTSSDTITPSS